MSYQGKRSLGARCLKCNERLDSTNRAKSPMLCAFCERVMSACQALSPADKRAIERVRRRIWLALQDETCWCGRIVQGGGPCEKHDP